MIILTQGQYLLHILGLHLAQLFFFKSKVFHQSFLPINVIQSSFILQCVDFYNGCGQLKAKFISVAPSKNQFKTV